MSAEAVRRAKKAPVAELHLGAYHLKVQAVFHTLLGAICISLITRIFQHFLIPQLKSFTMTEGQSTPQQAPPVAQAPLKSQKIPDIVDTFRPSKVGTNEHMMIRHSADNAF